MMIFCPISPKVTGNGQLNWSLENWKINSLCFQILNAQFKLNNREKSRYCGWDQSAYWNTWNLNDQGNYEFTTWNKIWKTEFPNILNDYKSTFHHENTCPWQTMFLDTGPSYRANPKDSSKNERDCFENAVNRHNRHVAVVNCAYIVQSRPPTGFFFW